MADGSFRVAGGAATGAIADAPPTQHPNWFTDLHFNWDASITVRSSGVRITLHDLTILELYRFFSYLSIVLVQGAKARWSSGRKYRVWFTPARPRPWYVVWSALTLAGIRLARGEGDADAVFYFEDVTIGVPPALDTHAVINAGCCDISKSRVEAAFAAAAGYPLSLDPAVHVGQAVEKSEENGRHDGRLVDCPFVRRPGKVYQRFVDSSEGATALDFRTTIINRKPLFVLVKTKAASERFSIHNQTVLFKSLEEVFSSAEVALITRFAEVMRLDWAALDILRDRSSGLIYIVDVNKTDTGPAVDLSRQDREKLKRAIARAFGELVRERAEAVGCSDRPGKETRRRATA